MNTQETRWCRNISGSVTCWSRWGSSPQKAIDRHYANLSAERSLDRVVQQDDAITISTTTGGEDGALDLLELKREVDLPPVVRLVNDVLIQAIDERASDIHIEPYEDRVLVRNRIDGILYDTMRVPAQFQLPVVCLNYETSMSQL